MVSAQARTPNPRGAQALTTCSNKFAPESRELAFETECIHSTGPGPLSQTERAVMNLSEVSLQA